jgi:hypothetical protein
MVAYVSIQFLKQERGLILITYKLSDSGSHMRFFCTSLEENMRIQPELSMGNQNRVSQPCRALRTTWHIFQIPAHTNESESSGKRASGTPAI